LRQQNSGVVEDFILPYLSTNPKVKELLKSVHICQSYRKSMAHGPPCSLYWNSETGTTVIQLHFCRW